MLLNSRVNVNYFMLLHSLLQSFRPSQFLFRVVSMAKLEWGEEGEGARNFLGAVSPKEVDSDFLSL